MEIITIEAGVFADLLRKIEELSKKVETFCGCQNLGDKKWLDAQDICQLLNISKRTLQKFRQQGLIRCSQINGKYYYKSTEVRTFLKTLQKPKP